ERTPHPGPLLFRRGEGDGGSIKMRPCDTNTSQSGVALRLPSLAAALHIAVASTFNRTSSRFWMLVIGASLELGGWHLELATPPLCSDVARPASRPSSTANPSPPDRETPASYFAAFALAGE